MAELIVEFFGGPLHGTTGTVRSTRAGRPPDLYAIDASAQGSRTRCWHDYRIGADPPAGHRWRYEYRGIRPG